MNKATKDMRRAIGHAKATRGEAPFRFAKIAIPAEERAESAMTDLSFDPRLATLACCIANQQKAGFGNYIDLRQVECPECKAPGFNTGWGFWQHACGNQILPDGEPGGEPCGGKPVHPASS